MDPIYIYYIIFVDSLTKLIFLTVFSLDFVMDGGVFDSNELMADPLISERCGGAGSFGHHEMAGENSPEKRETLILGIC